MKITTGIALLLPSAALLIPSCSSFVKQENPPNFVLILADDMGYSDIGSFGSEISTPNLDRLASEGLIMTRFYNAGRCCPSRASLMTGLYQHQVGVGDMLQQDSLPGYNHYLRYNGVTLAEALQPAGYFSILSGKWHLGHNEPYWPMKRGFDRQYASPSTTGHYFGIAKGRAWVIDDQWMEPRGEWIQSGSIEYQLFKNEDGSQWYATDAYTDRAIENIRELRDSLPEKPFFLYLAYTAPHWPLHAFPEDIQKYRDKYRDGWDVQRDFRYRKMLEKGILPPEWELSSRNERVPDWNSLDDSTKEYYSNLMAVYAAMVDRMDQNIGRLLKALEETGDLDNTLILFLSDNGGCHEAPHRGKPGAEPGSPDSFDGYEYAWANVSNTPFRWFKHWVHEGGISTPFIAWYPGMIEAGRMDTCTGHIIDIMPTFLELAGVEYPETFNYHPITPFEGRSLVPVFEGKTPSAVREPLFFEHEGNRAVIHDGWKLVSRFHYEENRSGAWELYHISGDRTESRDLSAVYPEKTEKLSLLYDSWAARCNVVPFEKIRVKRNPELAKITTP